MVTKSYGGIFPVSPRAGIYVTSEKHESMSDAISIWKWN